MAVLLLALILAVPAPDEARPMRDDPIRPVPLTAVRVDDPFWSPRLAVNRDVTVQYDFAQCEQTGRIDNFAIAGGLKTGAFRGTYYDDSDVFKVIEGASYVLAQQPDAKLDAYLDGLIAKIAAAQEDDGYLYTIRTIHGANITQDAAGPARWSNLKASHELYNVGHLYEAAVAHHQATGKRTLLDVALKNADLVERVFGPGERQRRDVPGHQEIELGLVKLYRATGQRRYLDLAKFFLDQRGRTEGRDSGGEATQDHKPVIEQHEAVGHAVRAGYMYAAMADVAALTGDERYVAALDRLWDDVVGRKMYLTGGVGATRRGEAFGGPYELPNATAYAETCASIAQALWNHRMFLLHGDSRYIDVLERVIYNGVLAGVSMEGNRFFYPNPLACDGRRKFNQGHLQRAPWFGCSCCPVNVVRFIPSIAGMAYACTDDALYVNLFIDGEASVSVGGRRVRLAARSEFPWDGHVRLELQPDRPCELALHVRIPGWAQNQPAPSDLYRYADAAPPDPVELTLNGKPVDYELDRGYAVIRREWQPGDQVWLSMPMPVRRVVAHARVAADRGRVAFERGPLVYCFEGVDNGDVASLFVADDARVAVEPQPTLLGGIVALRMPAQRVARADDGAIVQRPVTATAVPYYAWAHRAPGPMAVWIARDAEHAHLPPPPTIASRARASASHCYASDTVEALNDQIEPASSNDHDMPRFTWWSHRGTSEWVQYELAEPTRVSRVEVYWFDDTGRGQCRIPASWRLLYRAVGPGGAADGGDGPPRWTPVASPTGFGVEKDRFNRVDFDPVTTDALRIEVQLGDGVSGGILEWRVE